MMTTFGVIKRYRERLIGQIPTIMRLDGGPSFYREDWLHYTEWSLLHTVEEALLLGVDGVVVNLFLGGEMELRTYEIIAEVAGQALRGNLSLFVEAMPCPSERIPDTKATEAVASAARLAFEHGADYVKNYYTGSIDSYRQVVQWSPAPVLIAGGAKMDTEEQALQVTYDALQAGAAGVFFGRNVWQNPNMVGMIKALRHVIHDNGSVQEALNWLK
jgi:DhnA family fructose-bisphosphate aldolase class Ia